MNPTRTTAIYSTERAWDFVDRPCRGVMYKQSGAYTSIVKGLVGRIQDASKKTFLSGERKARLVQDPPRLREGGTKYIK